MQIVAQGLALSRAAGKLAWSEAIGARLGSAYARQGRVAEGRALIEEAISAIIRTKTLHHKVQLLNGLTDGQCIRKSHDSWHWLTCRDACVGISGHRFEIAGNQYPLQGSGFL